jgi:hypothetical protein
MLIILGISPWISTIQVGLDASRDKLQVLFGNHCDSFTPQEFREQQATISSDTSQRTLIVDGNHPMGQKNKITLLFMHRESTYSSCG